jgi:hypothetical protein
LSATLLASGRFLADGRFTFYNRSSEKRRLHDAVPAWLQASGAAKSADYSGLTRGHRLCHVFGSIFAGMG